MFLGWYDPDKKKPARIKVENAVERYVEKFGGVPETCLASSVDAEELAGDGKAPDLVVRAVNFLPRFTFYVGIDDSPPDVAEAA
ncbi:MAG: hypothetical protein ACRDJH_04045 [Thermomicrobiales bacterium]